jgi:putative ABC transport system permease protein
VRRANSEARIKRRHPLWSRAPWALIRYPGLALALCLGTLLLAVVAAAYPLFVSASGGNLVSAAVNQDSITRWGAGISFSYERLSFDRRPPIRAGNIFFPAPPDLDSAPQHERIDELFRRAFAGNVLFEEPASSALGPTVQIRHPDGSSREILGRLFTGSDPLAHVEILSGTEGSGVWLPDIIAGPLGVQPGDSIGIQHGGRSVKQTVDGIYRGLYAKVQTGYWRVWNDDIHRSFCPDPLGCSPLPQFVLVDADVFEPLSRSLGIEEATFSWQAPLARDHLTLADAQEVAGFSRGFVDDISRGPYARFFECCGEKFRPHRWTSFSSNMPLVVRDADRRLALLEGPGRVVQSAGLVVALVVIGAAGLFGVAARRSEMELLFARGSRPLEVAARSCLEATPPCLAGGILGIGLAYLLVRFAGPSGPIEAGAFQASLAVTATAVVASIVLIGAVATARFLHQSESHRGWMRILRVIPWEAGLLLLAYLAWRGLRGGGALVEDPALGIQRPSLLIIAFPLILLAAAGLIGARLFAASARWIRARSGGFPPSAYLAVHRLAGGRLLALALVAGSALALGVFVQSQTLVRSLETTVHAKARVYVGSDVQLRVDYQSLSPDEPDVPLTRVVRYPAAGVLSNGGTFDLLAVDHATFADAAYWNDAFSRTPVAEIAQRLGASSTSSVPVVLAGQTQSAATSIELAQVVVPVREVASATAFPGMTSQRPLVVVDEQALLSWFEGQPNPLNSTSASTEFWLKGDEASIRRAVASSGYLPELVLSASEVEDIPYVAALVDTFAVLNAIGLAAALLVIAGMLMYLQGRERSQIVSYGLSLRMGMTHGAHRRALAYELGAMLGASYLVGVFLAITGSLLIVPMLDPLGAIPPSPLFVTPSRTIGAAVTVLAASALAGAWVASRRVRSFDFGEAMRVAG